MRGEKPTVLKIASIMKNNQVNVIVGSISQPFLMKRILELAPYLSKSAIDCVLWMIDILES